MALEAACRIRNDTLDKFKQGFCLNKTLTVEECFNKEKDLFPLSYKSKERHQSTFKHAIKAYHLDGIDISKLSASQLQQSLIKYAKTNSQGCVNDALTIWRRIYQIAAMEGLSVTDKTKMLQPIKSKVITKKRDVTISHEDFDQFCIALLNYNKVQKEFSFKDQFRNQAIWFMLQIMLYTGLRPSEVMALSREDIHITDDTQLKDYSLISVSKAVGSTADHKQQIVPPKTKTSNRQVPITSDLKPILVNLLAWSHNDPLLADFNGNPFDIDFVSNYIHLVSKSCGIKFNAYMLRHLFSTDLFHDHVNPRVVQDLMGHSSQSMSLYYARSSEEDRITALQNRRLSSEEKEMKRS